MGCHFFVRKFKYIKIIVDNHMHTMINYVHKANSQKENVMNYIDLVLFIGWVSLIAVVVSGLALSFNMFFSIEIVEGDKK